MKTLSHWIIWLVVTALVVPSQALGQLSQQSRAELPTTEIVKNPGFESGKIYWTASGGTFATTTTAANVGAGTTSASWDASGAQTLTSAQVTVPAGLYGAQCQAGVLYKGGDSNLTLQAIDGSSVVKGSVALSTAAVYQTAYVLFTCPTSGTMALRVAAGADAAIVYLDRASIRNVPNVAGVLDPLADDPTGVEGRLYYNTTSKKAKLYNGTAWGDLGGSGAGEKNYITDGSRATGWTCVGDLAVTTTTTAADLPRENTTASGIKITADADTQSTADYCYHDFTLDDVDLGKKLKLEWAQKTTGTFAAGDLEVIVTTQADRTTALATPSLTSIPAYDFVFPSSFDSTTTATLSLVIRATTDMATNGGIVISDVIVGPSAIIQGYPGSGPHSWTPTGSWVSNTTYGGVYYQDGSKLSGKFYVSVTGAPTAASLTVDLPADLTLDATAFATNTSYTVGRGWIVDASTSARYSATATVHPTQNFMTIRVDAQSANTVTAIDRVDTNVSSTVPTTFASGDSVIITFHDIPIAEWAGAGVNVVGNDGGMYACSTTGTWDAASAAGDTVHGPAGCPISGALTAARDKVVRLPRPLSLLGDARLQYKKGGIWVDQASSPSPFLNFPARAFGATVQAYSGNDVTIRFNQYAVPGTTYNSTTGAIDWPVGSVTDWRVRYPSTTETLGFKEADQDYLGLVKAGQVPGTNTDDDAEAGSVGEYLEASASIAVTSGAAAADVTSLVLTAGDWDIQAYAFFNYNSASTATSSQISLSKTSGTLFSGLAPVDGEVKASLSTASSFNDHTLTTPIVRVSIATSRTYYLTTTAVWTTSTLGVQGTIMARRVR